MTIKVLEYDDAFSSACRECTIASSDQTIAFKHDTSPRHDGGSSSSSWRQRAQYCFVVAPRRVLSDLFLPVGYPHSVREEYMGYQICDSLQGLCSYLRGVVATSAVLTAAGVGDSEATAMSAAMTWAMRDGSGMVGGLLFSYCASSMFDSHVKEFRLFADIANDVGLALDMLAPYARNNILYITSFATVCKVMCGIAAGSTKGSITHHFALRGNMADLNAKESTQETLVSLLGMLLGVALARYLHRLEQQEQDISTTTSAAMVSWTIFIVLTVLHVWANYVGVKLLRLRTLNRQRATVALQDVIRAVATKCTKGEQESVSTNALLASIKAPQDVFESLGESLYHLFIPGSLRLGARLQDTFMGLSYEEMAHSLQEEFHNERYVLSVVGSVRVSVTLHVGASDQDELKAFLHAMILRECIRQGALRDDSAKDHKSLTHVTHNEVNALFGETAKINADEQISVLEVLKEKGWDVESRLYLGFGKWRIRWSSEKRE